MRNSHLQQASVRFPLERDPAVTNFIDRKHPRISTVKLARQRTIGNTEWSSSPSPLQPLGSRKWSALQNRPLGFQLSKRFMRNVRPATAKAGTFVNGIPLP